ncbi:MAG: YafY family protein [Pseudomonadota bacterium]
MCTRPRGPAIKRFDRFNAILVLLHGRRHVRAADLAARFGVSERSIYRDIRALEAAGIPILGEPGVGYRLDRSYRLPPVNFQSDEALALAIAAKFAATRLGGRVAEDATRAMDKVLTALAPVERQRLTDFVDTVALPDGNTPTPSGQGDGWLGLLQQALTERRVVELDYCPPARPASRRAVEPIGVCHYSQHWHLIAWCRRRSAYRDFRLDRIREAHLQAEHVPADRRTGIEDYLATLGSTEALIPVAVVFDARMAHVVGAERYRHGFIDAETRDDGVHMRFMCAHTEYLCRWLLQYTTGVLHLDGGDAPEQWQALVRALSDHATAR